MLGLAAQHGRALMGQYALAAQQRRRATAAGTVESQDLHAARVTGGRSFRNAKQS
jgi:hypothetical protein